MSMFCCLFPPIPPSSPFNPPLLGQSFNYGEMDKYGQIWQTDSSGQFVSSLRQQLQWHDKTPFLQLGLYAPDCPKSTSKYLLFTTVVRKHASRFLTAMYNFGMQCAFKQLFWTAQWFKLLQTHILNVVLPKLQFFLSKNQFDKIWVVF